MEAVNWREGNKNSYISFLNKKYTLLGKTILKEQRLGSARDKQLIQDFIKERTEILEELGSIKEEVYA